MNHLTLEFAYKGKLVGKTCCESIGLTQGTPVFMWLSFMIITEWFEKRSLLAKMAHFCLSAKCDYEFVFDQTARYVKQGSLVCSLTPGIKNEWNLEHLIDYQTLLYKVLGSPLIVLKSIV